MTMKAAFGMGRLLLATALVCTALSGCQTPPKPTPTPAEARAAELRKVGFARSDDGWELSLGVKLLFETDRDAVSDSGQRAIDEVSATLKRIGVERIRVEGHTDNVGTPAYNKSLSLRRAESVAQQLVRTGWRDDMIERRAHGLEKPIADNSTPEGRAQNRRVVITVPSN